MEIDNVQLERLRISARRYLHGQALLDLKLDKRYDEVCKQMVIEISTNIMAEERADDSVTFRTPLTWWDYIKEGLNKRFKRLNLNVKHETTKYHFKMYQAYPKLNQAFPPEDKGVTKSFLHIKYTE